MNIGKRYLGFIDFSTIIVALIITYMSWCIYDIIESPSKSGIDYIFVEKGYNTGEIKERVEISNPFDLESIAKFTMNVNPGDTVHVGFRTIRYKPTSISIDRLFVSSGGQEYHISSITRNVTDTNLGTRRIESDYRIPLFLKEGCGAYIYSRRTHEYNYNILTQIKPPTFESPKINLCIDSSTQFNSKNITIFP